MRGPTRNQKIDFFELHNANFGIIPSLSVFSPLPSSNIEIFQTRPFCFSTYQTKKLSITLPKNSHGTTVSSKYYETMALKDPRTQLLGRRSIQPRVMSSRLILSSEPQMSLWVRCRSLHLVRRCPLRHVSSRGHALRCLRRNMDKVPS